MATYRDYLPTLRFMPTLAVSPSGADVAYVDDDLGQFNVVVQALSGSDRRTLTAFTDSSVSRVAWHPYEPTLVFQADTKGDEFTRVCQVRLGGGDPEVLASAPRVRYMIPQDEPFSPDGRLLAYTGTDREPGDDDVLVRDMASGGVSRIFTGGGRTVLGSWSPDGTRLVVAQWLDSSSEHVVHVAFADGSPARRLTRPGVPATYWLGPWLRDGSGFLVRSNFGREFTGLASLDATTGEFGWLDTPEWDVESVALSADGRVLVWGVNVDGCSQLQGRDQVTGNDLPMPVLPAGVASGLWLTADGRTLVLRLYTATEPASIVAVDLKHGERRRLTDSRPSADPATFIEPRAVQIPADGGRGIPSYLYRPRQSSGRVGVLLSIHGGPAYQERPLYSMYNGLYQYLLHHGVAVVAPNVRGSTGYGASYQHAIHRDWGGVDLEDFAAVAAYLRDQEWVDPDRIGVLGASYGGFAVLSCLSRLPEFNWAAGVDMFGPSNLVTFAKSQPPTWRQKVLKVVGDPNADAGFLMSRSPVTFADQIRAPLFVIQGANDPRVPRAESDQIVQRLRSRGVEVRYDVYPDAGHGFGKREDQIKAYSDVAEFLVAHLGAPRRTT